MGAGFYCRAGLAALGLICWLFLGWREAVPGGGFGVSHFAVE
jgi:hypothetical protein